VHFNPNVQQPVRSILDNLANVSLIEPQEYLAFVYLMMRAYLIITDSGEFRRKPLRWGSRSSLYAIRPNGLRRSRRVLRASWARVLRLSSRPWRSSWTTTVNTSAWRTAHSPYGDGRATERIVAALERRFLELPQRRLPISAHAAAPVASFADLVKRTAT